MIEEGGPDVEPREAVAWKPIVAILVTLVLLFATVGYNNLAAPAAPVVTEVSVAALGGGSLATAVFLANLSTPTPAIGSHYLFDAVAKVVVPLSGGTTLPVEMGVASEAVADGDTFVWIERGPPSAVKYFDVPRGLLRSVAVDGSRDPIEGTLVAGGGLVAWSYHTPSGFQGVGGFVRGTDAVTAFTSSPAENRTAVAALGGDALYTTTAASDDLWVYNLSTERVMLLAAGPGVANVSVGSFFAVWVNQSASLAEYFDRNDRVVRTLPAPAGVDPRWALADGLTVLIGGLKKGLIFTSPRVEFYDFSTGNSHIYDSVGVDFEVVPYFGYADSAVVIVASHQLPRPSAPFTPYLLAVLVISGFVTALLAARELGRPEA